MCTMTNVRSRLTIEPVTADDEAGLHAWFELETAARAVDLPHGPPLCWHDHRATLTAPWPGEQTMVWLARSGDAVVGCAQLGLPVLDNVENAFGGIVVAPMRRRAGIGTSLLDHLVAQARNAGRVRLFAEVPEQPAAGPAFVARAGAVRALAEQRRRLHLPPDDVALAELDAQARVAADGYRLVQWTGHTPEEYLDDLAYLTGRMSTDAPLGDLHVEPTQYDAGRIRARDAAHDARGHQVTITGAVHVASGQLVAFTDITVYATVPTHGRQRDTLVAPEHRGHRLGMLIKLANLARARRDHPLIYVTTWNADSNPYMVAINEAMGFRPLDRWAEWELELMP